MVCRLAVLLFSANAHEPWQNRGTGRHAQHVKSMHAYSALVAGVDHNVGRVVKRLEEIGPSREHAGDLHRRSGLERRTPRGLGQRQRHRSFQPVRRVAARAADLESSRARSAPGRRSIPWSPPTITSRRFSITSAFPRPPVGRPGRSYAGFLSGARPQWRDRLYFEYEYVRGIRTENLKYIERTKEWPSELFDLGVRSRRNTQRHQRSAAQKTARHSARRVESVFQRERRAAHRGLAFHNEAEPAKISACT